MQEISISVAQNINHLHERASSTARKAIDYAREAGRQLLMVKEQLPHGEFGKWREKYLNISERTCQRYMSVALGKAVPVRSLAKSDTVSVLPDGVSEEEFDGIRDGTWIPQFQPQPGHWFVAHVDDVMYWVVPHVDNPEKFHVSRLHWEQDGEEQIESYIATRWPERADMVEFRLKCYGLPKPCDADWKSKKAEGLPRPFGADENHGKFQIVGKDGRERWLQDAP